MFITKQQPNLIMPNKLPPKYTIHFHHIKIIKKKGQNKTPLPINQFGTMHCKQMGVPKVQIQKFKNLNGHHL